MNIELKHIKFYRQLSKDSLCFSAKIHVDGKWFLNCENKGEGGISTYELRDYFDKEAKVRLQEIEQYFIELPPVTRKIPKEIDAEENEYTIKMNLAEWIDMQIDDAWCRKEELRLKDLQFKRQDRLKRKQTI